MRKFIVLLLILNFIRCGQSFKKNITHLPFENGRLQVSENGRFLKHAKGEPFFWLGDTGWLLFQKLDRSEANSYLEDRRKKGFNVIQVMVIHNLPAVNVYGDTAFINKDPTKSNITAGNNPDDPYEYDYWDHVDYILDVAAAKGIYLAMVVAWGSIVKAKYLTVENAETYTKWLANRYMDRPNVIWINGGDIRGDVETEVWDTIGNTLNKTDPNHLITFHPFGRTQSSTWFHEKSWLDFNMFQSGHRRYDQIRDTDDKNNWKGEDNWKYVQEDYAKMLPKPIIDGEPSYENIPQGLHDPTEPYWTDNDVRRYAYWSVFAGSFGHTYGNNAVMQMHKPNSDKGAYGVRNYWYEAIDDPGAGQMQYLKALILSRPFFERIPDQSLIAGENGTQYGYVIATRGKSYAFIYSYTGREFGVSMGKISGKTVKAYWYNPRNGSAELLGSFENSGIQYFNPPGEKQDGSDWLLVLDDEQKNYKVPGTR